MLGAQSQKAPGLFQVTTAFSAAVHGTGHRDTAVSGTTANICRSGAAVPGAGDAATTPTLPQVMVGAKHLACTQRQNLASKKLGVQEIPRVFLCKCVL